MSKQATITELRSMTEQDLVREVNEQYRTVAKLRMGLQSGKDKGSHLYRREKRQLSQMLTVLSEIRRKPVKTAVSATH